MEFAYPLVGFIVGSVVGLTGVGGGALMTPLLVFGFGVVPLTAVGTDLMFAAITKSSGIAAHGLRDNIDWGLFRWLALGSIPASLLSIVGLSRLEGSGYRGDAFILPTLGVALLLTAMAILSRQRLRDWVLRSAPQFRVIPEALRTVVAGTVLGVLVTVTSVGAGALGVAALMMLRPKMAAKRIVGTDIAHAVPLAGVAAFGHLRLGHIDWILLASLLIGSIPGIWVGTVMGSRLPEAYMRHILVGVLLTVGLICLWP